MPEKEGIETIIELSHNYPELKVIAISGNDNVNPEMARHLGADAALKKPFTVELLKNTVDSLLKNKKKSKRLNLFWILGVKQVN